MLTDDDFFALCTKMHQASHTVAHAAMAELAGHSNVKLVVTDDHVTVELYDAEGRVRVARSLTLPPRPPVEAPAAQA